MARFEGHDAASGLSFGEFGEYDDHDDDDNNNDDVALRNHTYYSMCDCAYYAMRDRSLYDATIAHPRP
jgi:hypothetical protein